MNAISIVESGNDPSAVNPEEMAIGLLQIRQIYVDDVNRIAKTNYKHDDAFNPKKSEEMFLIYARYWGKRAGRLQGRPVTLEDIARCHNGGPNGFRKESTDLYWERVEYQFEKLLDESLKTASSGLK